MYHAKLCKSLQRSAVMTNSNTITIKSFSFINKTIIKTEENENFFLMLYLNFALVFIDKN